MNSQVNRSWRWTLGSAAAAVGLAAFLAGRTGLGQVEERIPLKPRSPATDAPAPAAAANPVKLYKVPADRLATLAADLQKQFAGQSGIHIGADEQTSNLVVVGPTEAQQQVVRWLAAAAQPAPVQPAAAAPSPAAAAAAAPVRIGRTTHTLKNISPRDAELELASVWGKTAAFGTSRGGETTTVRIPAGNHGEVLLVVDHERSLVTIDAPQDTLASWERVIANIDAPRRGTAQVGVIPFDRADPLKIQRAIQLIHTATKSPAALPGRVQDAIGTHGRRQHIGQFVSMIFQDGQPAAAQPGGQPPAPPAVGQPGGDQPPPAVDVQPGQPVGGEGAAGALSRIGNVQIEFVEGLDILIIRGNKRDVDMVKEIIRQIEELSIQTQPEIEIYYLQNVDGQQITDVITTIYATAFPSQGQVTLTPLVKPNAVLVIGRKEAIGPVLELIRRLDVPVAPETQLRVFPLKFLPAVDAERTVRSFFTVRPGQVFDQRIGLGTRVSAIADFRSNSLIVQASPRDMEEVARLLEQIDVEGIDKDKRATNEVRVFKLQNSLADDLVLVIQEAITGQVQGQQQQQQQQQQQGAQGGAGTPTPQASARREVRLQMFAVDQEGRRMIESGILSDLAVSSDPRSNSLIIVGPPSTMPLMEELIRQLDAPPGGEAQVKVFTILNGDATQLATMLQSVFGTATQGAAGLGNAGFQSSTGTGASPLVPLRFAVDTRTNSIIATGSSSDLAVVYRILIRLDEAGIRQRELKVYRLKNTSATAVATSLQTFLSQQQQLQQAQGQLISALERLEEQVIVVDDPVTNSLIVSATTRYMPQVDKLIEQLDRRNPMVVIQLVIAEVTLSDINEFGAQFGLQDSLLFQRGIPTPGFNFNNQPLGNVTTGNTQNVAGQGLTDLSVGRSNTALGFGGLVLSASSESVAILIRALQQSNRVQILSRPQVQTMDNQPAYVQVGSDTPRVTQTQPNTLGGFSNSFQDVPVGIILGVTPRVTPDGMVVMEIDAEKSEVGSTSDPGALTVSVNPTTGLPTSVVPPIRRTKAQTTITARSGQTVILGGLITKTDSETTRRVPYLADVPVLGRLFRFDSTSVDRREIMFILTPYIMDSQDTEANFNMRETERMSWCLADIVNVHSALPIGTAGANAVSHESPLIFPDETPSGPSVIAPGEQVSPPLQPLPTPTPTPAIPAPEIPPQSRRRAAQPLEQAASRPQPWRPAAAVPQEVQPAIQWQEQPADADGPQPPPMAQQEQHGPTAGSLTPATIAPAGYQQPLPSVYPVAERSIYEP